MDKKDLYRSMQEIDDEILEESEKKTKNKPWLKFAVIAACTALVITAAAITVPLLTKSPAAPDEPTVIKDNRYDENKTALASEVAIGWPWQYLTSTEKYTIVMWNSEKYLSRGNEISEELLGESLGECEESVYAHDGYNVKTYTAKFTVRTIKDVDKNRLIAVNIDGINVVFRRDIQEEQAFPATLGELYNEYGLSKTLKLDRYCEKNGYSNGDYFTTDAGQYVIDALADCGDAPLISAEGAYFDDTYGITFTATSESLGIYKRSFIITEEGYLCTTIEEYGYTFEIGKDKASDIISYVKAHSEKAEYEPYYNTVVGVITEIGDGYILIDDSVLCKDEKDGIVFKIPTDSMIVRRWIEYYHLKTGDAVMIEYKGDISKDYTVNGIVSMSEAIITEEGVIVEE